MPLHLRIDTAVDIGREDWHAVNDALAPLLAALLLLASLLKRAASARKAGKTAVAQMLHPDLV